MTARLRKEGEQEVKIRSRTRKKEDARMKGKVKKDTLSYGFRRNRRQEQER